MRSTARSSMMSVSMGRPAAGSCAVEGVSLCSLHGTGTPSATRSHHELCLTPDPTPARSGCGTTRGDVALPLIR